MAYTSDLYEEGKEVNVPTELEKKATPPPVDEPEVLEPTEDSGTLESEIVNPDEEIDDELTEISDSDPEPAGHRSKAAEKRIKQLVAERKQLLKMLESQQQIALFQSGQSPQNQQQVPQEQVIDPNAPNPANYTNDVDYLVDLKFYQREQKAKQEKFATAQAELLKKHPEIPQLVEEANLKSAQGIITNSPAMELLISESDQPTDLWFYLLSHQDEAAQIAKLSPMRAAKAVALIEQKLTPATETQTTKRQLPPPINPVKVTKAVGKTSSIESY